MTLANSTAHTTAKSISLLAMDTSTEGCSVALLQQQAPASTVTADFILSPREHTQRILPMVDTILAQGKASLGEMNALVYGRGPGSFTGVRIGIGIAQGLAFGADIPMIGISTLQAMAQQAHAQSGATRVLAAIDARMGEVYWGEYQCGENGIMMLAGEEQVASPSAVIEQYRGQTFDFAAVGTGWQAYPELATAFAVTDEVTVRFPSAEFMLPAALEHFLNGETVAAEQATPVYLRDKVTWKKLPGRE
ncbi:tRNA (adenosine(37)-N6)-threonylcarbamoyltransferase complex dimerization subunit type 1 TsaB [Motilimonas eburnea]|uniref:tRNA (adenosine(37)-N6)-threonylcarbamoyltransferase complex dimerization subunit type 1 TsaB n=1 Tax=Motilimonas eburnea TaxID=1737488 RepID=UPI001E562F56|nr:tRNA (adenosine(37)-N6)-threonylcarbamoyltransferase complex dimerization subunit type 1 TsaB [Motilimonas eburnea]MCE2571905.1 tRNA (adenosine(37)-N6)-threonylcarbamoyltransferase complex dimerization subunit type 1 TsaB [Motilimonas eburnea]